MDLRPLQQASINAYSAIKRTIFCSISGLDGVAQFMDNGVKAVMRYSSGHLRIQNDTIGNADVSTCLVQPRRIYSFFTSPQFD